MIRKTLCALVVLVSTLGANTDNLFYVGPTWNVSKANLKDVGEFTGNRWGVVGGFEHFQRWNFYGNLEIEYFQGTLHDGQNNFELKQAVSFYNARLGYVLPFYTFDFTPYTGLSMQYIHETRRFTTSTSNSFKYYMPFIPFGIMAHANINEEWFVGLNYQFQMNFDSYLEISTLQGARWELKPRTNQFVELEISYQPVEIFSIRFIPYYHNYRIGSTTASTSTGLQLGIPKQSYKTFGAALEFALHF